MEHSLRRILPSDKRQNINRKFDDSVAEFFAMAYHFDCEIEAVPENDEKTMQSLGLKFLEDMNLIIENAIKHDFRSKNPTTRWSDVIKLK